MVRYSTAPTFPWGANPEIARTATFSYPVPLRKYPEVVFAPLSRTLENIIVRTNPAIEQQNTESNLHGQRIALNCWRWLWKCRVRRRSRGRGRHIRSDLIIRITKSLIIVLPIINSSKVRTSSDCGETLFGPLLSIVVSERHAGSLESERSCYCQDSVRTGISSELRVPLRVRILETAEL